MKVYESMSFVELGLAPWVLDQVKAVGFKAPTDIQYHCIPAILKGEQGDRRIESKLKDGVYSTRQVAIVSGVQRLEAGRQLLLPFPSSRDCRRTLTGYMLSC